MGSTAIQPKVQPLVLGGGTIVPPVQMRAGTLHYTTTGQKTFYYRTVNIWNNLNNDIKLCIDVNSFRNKLRGVLLDKFKGEE